MKVIVSVIALAACGVTPANSLNGMVGGQSIVIAQAVWAAVPASSVGYTGGQAAIVTMSTEPDLCARLSSNTVLPGEKLTTLEMVDTTGGDNGTALTSMSAPRGPGSYAIPIEAYWLPKTGSMGTTFVDAQCKSTGVGEFHTGDITVSSIEGATLIGSFSAYDELAGGGDVSGTFAPQYCPGLAITSQSAQPACQPM